MTISRSREFFLLSLLAAIQFVHIVDFMILMPLGPQLMRIFQIDTTRFSLLISAYTFSAGIAGFAGAFWLDRFDRRANLVFMMTGFTLGTSSCAFSWSFESLLAARIIAGMFGGVLNAQVYAIVADVIPYDRRGRATGFIMSAFSLASVAGVPLGLYLANQRDWQLPFEVLGGFALLILILSFIVVPSLRHHIVESEHKEKSLTMFLELFKVKKHQTAFIFILFMMIAGFSVIPFISNYLVANLKFPESKLPVMYALGGGATFFSARFIGYLADRFGKANVFRWDAFASMLPLLAITHLTTSHFGTILTVSTLFFILVSGRMIPALAMISAAAKPSVRGSFLSMVSSLQQLGSGLAAVVAGSIIIHPPGQLMQNYPIVGYLAVASTLICIFLAGKLEPHEK